METLEMIYLYVVLMDYAKSFWALHFTFSVMLHGTIFNATFLREKSIPCNMTINLLQQPCKNLKPVQSFATRCGNKCCVKNRLQTPLLRFCVQ